MSGVGGWTFSVGSIILAAGDRGGSPSQDKEGKKVCLQEGQLVGRGDSGAQDEAKGQQPQEAPGGQRTIVMGEGALGVRQA